LTPSNGAGPGSQAQRTIDVSQQTGGSDVLVGAGDIADCGRTQDNATANLLDGIAGTVFTAGDNAYPNGTSTDFNNLLRPDLGTPEGPHQAGHREPRVRQLEQRGRLLRVLRVGGWERRSGLLQL
jgi:hypothetical protein